MKKLLLTACLIAGFAGSLFAQYDAKALKALEVLDKVSSKYEKMNGFTADFVYTLKNDQAAGLSAEYNGRIAAKGKKFKVEVIEMGMDVMSDGDSVWIFMPEAKEVTVHRFEDVVAKDVNPSNIHNLYKKGYKHEYQGEKMINGAPHHVIELVPDNPGESNLSKIELVIHKQSLTIGSFTIHEKNGNRYVVDIRNFNSDVSLKDEIFIFRISQHPGVDVIKG